MLQPTTSDTRIPLNWMVPFRRLTTRRAPRGVGQSSIDLLAMVGRRNASSSPRLDTTAVLGKRSLYTYNGPNGVVETSLKRVMHQIRLSIIVHKLQMSQFENVTGLRGIEGFRLVPPLAASKWRFHFHGRSPTVRPHRRRRRPRPQPPGSCHQNWHASSRHACSSVTQSSFKKPILTSCCGIFSNSIAARWTIQDCSYARCSGATSIGQQLRARHTARTRRARHAASTRTGWHGYSTICAWCIRCCHCIHRRFCMDPGSS